MELENNENNSNPSDTEIPTRRQNMRDCRDDECLYYVVDYMADEEEDSSNNGDDGSSTEDDEIDDIVFDKCERMDPSGNFDSISM